MRSSVALGPLQLRYSPFTAQMPDLPGLCDFCCQAGQLHPADCSPRSVPAIMPECRSAFPQSYPRESTSRPFFPISKFRRSCGAVSGAQSRPATKSR